MKQIIKTSLKRLIYSSVPILRKVKGILIEINDKFTTQANDASKYLQEAGFSLKEKNMRIILIPLLARPSTRSIRSGFGK